MVQLCIFLCLSDRKCGSIYTQYAYGTGNSGVQRKRACVCETVKNFCILTKTLDRKSVVFLVKKEAGLLTVFYVNNIVYAIFNNFHVRVEFIPNESLEWLHPFIYSNFSIATLINTFDYYTIRFKDIF